MAIFTNELISGVGEDLPMSNPMPQSTWASRPVNAAVGDLLLITDVGPAPGTQFVWSGTRWVTTQPSILAGSAVAAGIFTGSLLKTAQTQITVPGGLLGPNGYLEVEFLGTVNNSAAIKLWNITFGGTDFYHAAPSVGTYHGGFARIANRNTQAAQIGTPMNQTHPWGIGTNTMMVGTVDTTVNQTLAINTTLVGLSDTMQLQAWQVRFMSRG